MSVCQHIMTGVGPLSGLGPNSGDEFLEEFKSVDDFDLIGENKNKFSEHLQKPTEEPESFTILTSLRNAFARLGSKFGYIKKSAVPTEPLTEPSNVFDFQCMTADDLPITVDGQPVRVAEPKDCHRYFRAVMDSGVQM